jgi:DeoR family fructose operon transcriptional repressor
MWAGERQQRILALLAGNGQLSTDRLARDLQVSRETVRRDLVTLEASGLLRRRHGGVLATDAPAEAPYQIRREFRRAEKARIAQAAIRLVKPGELCFIEAGTTTSAFAAALAAVPDVSVITNSLEVASLTQNGRPEGALLLGGRMSSDVPGTFGEVTLDMVRQFSVDAAIVSPVALSSEGGAMTYHLAEAMVARAMIAQADRVIMLADSSKLGVASRVQIAACPQIDILVTDDGAATEMLDALRQAGIGHILVA